MDQITVLCARLGECAAGSWQEEAAVWLLATHGYWLSELERTGLIIDDESSQARIAWRHVAAACLNAGDGPLTATADQWQVLRLACMLTGRHVLSLANLTILDEPSRRLALHAMAWAAGGHAWAASLSLLPPAFGAESPASEGRSAVHASSRKQSPECRHPRKAGTDEPDLQAEGTYSVTD
ncbi:hypothetical protein [Streptomyces sp. NPDC059378]|uniref:hypothetical protein n=1 Tax=Streptomyces sp. NPDC059378 TaxID=3346815 RepID=UPI0036C6548B